MIKEKKMHLIFLVPYIDAGREQPEPKWFISLLSLQGKDKRKRSGGKKRRIKKKKRR